MLRPSLSIPLSLCLLFLCSADLFAQSLFPVRVGDRWGYIDRNGVMRIEPQFSYAYDFDSAGRFAAVRLDHLWGVIDTAGEWVHDPVYEWASNTRRRDPIFSLRDRESRRWLVNSSGELRQLPPRNRDTIYEPWEWLRLFRSGGAADLTPFFDNDRFGYRDASGAVRIPAQYGLARPFSGLYAPVSRTARIDSTWVLSNERKRRFLPGTWELIDTAGETVLSSGYTDLVSLDTVGEYWLFRDESGKAGVLRPDGAVVVPARYDSLFLLIDELFVAEQRHEKYRHSSRYQIVDASRDLELLPAWMHRLPNLKGDRVFWGDYPMAGRRTIMQENPDTAIRCGVLDRSGTMLLEIEGMALYPIEGDRFIYISVTRTPEGEVAKPDRQKRGIIALDGTVILEPRWDWIRDLDSAATVFAFSTKKGSFLSDTENFIGDLHGNVIYPLGDYSVEPVAEGVIRLDYRTDHHYTMIRRDGRLLGTLHSRHSGYDNGIFVTYRDTNDSRFRFDRVTELRDTTDRLLFSLDRISPTAKLASYLFGERLAAIKEGEEVWYYSFDGIRRLGPYRHALGFRDGYSTVAIEDEMQKERWGVIDRSGRWVVPPVFDSLDHYNPHGLTPAAVRNEDLYTWGYIDRDLEWAISPQFDGARPFSSGRAAVMMLGDSGTIYEGGGCLDQHTRVDRIPAWGFIDESGTVVVPIRFSEVGDFEGDAASAWTTEGRGLIDPFGRWRFDSTRFTMIGSYSDGVAPARKSIRYIPPSYEEWDEGYIDKDGEWVIAPQYHTADPFHSGVAVVTSPALTTTYTYITTDGRVLFDGRESVEETDEGDEARREGTVRELR